MIRTHLRTLAVMLCMLSACAPKDEGTGDIGGTMVVVQPQEPKSLFPVTSTGTDAGVIIGSVFDRLVELGQKLETNNDAEFVPRLATSWQWSNDSLSIAFRLDSAARWHDGVPLRANDVRFTFGLYSSDTLDSGNRSLLDNIDSVTARDSLTAVFWFKRRLPHQLFDATYPMFILPSHLLDTVPQATMATTFGNKPVGTGRFRFVRWDKGARVEIMADTGNSRSRAKLDRVIVSFVPDGGAATVKLFAGDADLYEAMSVSNLAQVAASKQLRTEPYPSLRYDFMSYNLHMRGDSMMPHPLFADVRVRRALAMAVDRVSLARNVWDSLGSVALTAAPRVFIPDTNALRQIPFDPAGARALLDSLGWIVSPADGVRARGGVRFSFEVMAQQSSPTRQAYVVILQQQLKAIGVEIRPLTLEGNVMGGRAMKGDYDAFMTGWLMNPGRLGMAQTWRSNGDQNYGKYRNLDFDRMLDSAMTSLNTRASNQRWTAVMQQLIDDQPGMWLAEGKTPITLHRRIRIAPLRPDGWQATLADWTIDPAQRIDRDRIGLRSDR